MGSAVKRFLRQLGRRLVWIALAPWVIFLPEFVHYLIGLVFGDWVLQELYRLAQSNTVTSHLATLITWASTNPASASVILAAFVFVYAAIRSELESRQMLVNGAYPVRVEKGRGVEGAASGQVIDADELPSNLTCTSCGVRQITVGDKLNWTHTTFLDRGEPQVGLVANFSNLARRDSRVGRASAIWARITYVQEEDREQQRGATADPGAWLDRPPSFSLSVGEGAELLLALVVAVPDQPVGGSMVSKLRPVEDHRFKETTNEMRYRFGPFLIGNIIAAVTLTANDMAVGPFKFLLKSGLSPTIQPLVLPAKHRFLGLLSRVRNLRGRG